jgi:nitrogen regulatory protein P-II 1
MKKIEAIIRPERLEDVKDALATINIRGISITQIVGCGVQNGWTEIYRGNEYQLNFRPKVKIEIVTDNDRLEEVIDVIVNSARTGEIGDGKIFVSEIIDVIRIRTGERGKVAL